ncbi:DUF106 domain-containing protein [Candidatus Pacearchaeota archaeon]|nr:DUF106 domain-containing protein [Candidatus Pacearchaeota archaeon]
MEITTFIQSNPKLGILVLSLIATVVLTVITYFFTDRNLMKSIKEKQKKLREEMKLYRDDAQKMMEINKKMMEDFPVQMKQSFKIMIITLLPVLVFFNWLRNVLSTTTLADSWVWWYIISSIVFSIVLRKVFKID